LSGVSSGVSAVTDEVYLWELSGFGA